MRKVFAIFLSTSSEVSSKKGGGGGRNKVGETSTAFFPRCPFGFSFNQVCAQGLLLFDKAGETCGGVERAESF